MEERMIWFSEAIREAISMEMRNNPDVYMAGEDIGIMGGSFGVTSGMIDEFGEERVIDTPISETAIVGHAVGAAAAGMRPVVELMFSDFMMVCGDELMNQAAKMHFMFGGKAKVPMVVRAATGAGARAAAQHSQCPESMILNFPGLKVVCPSTARDAKGLMLSAIRDDNPVVFLEHRMLYWSMGDVPEGDCPVPIGKADIRRTGSDVTLIAWGAMVEACAEAAEELSADGIDAEIVDLRSLAPLDKAAILTSVEKTNRVVVVQEAPKTGGFGGEVAAILAEEGFDFLDAPIKRVCAPDTPVPFSPVLEDYYIPDAQRVVEAVKSLM
ncbi:TPP-dependent acetoin dehydrogenase complex, E1 protein subunit beta [Desulfoluna limicola]|uniref:TPP-dependent acetoin dehydrogenase complex, E1 protein subunit beta n=1 Tax=Desulfoluna limicola TaxID=2810562 RepID=A0ABM7PEU0_9BACT|nr:alpha-ketoacid dehydrogenase subunit beta [Desulfoluna limicola]BCS95749.1 TPP-dependent acetoin dehydrogenase complex, E1 protein subunit beta [Desulfoluna limicola]